MRADQAAEAQELARAELVGIVLRRHVAQVLEVGIVGPEVGAARPALPRAHAVAPIVRIGEAAAGPAHDARFDLPERVYQCTAHTAHVRHLRAFTHPTAIVDHAAQVLDEVPVQLGRDRADRFIDEDLEPRIVGLRAHRGRVSSGDRGGGAGGRGAEERAAGGVSGQT